MARIGDLQVRITAVDEVSPVLRRLRWMLWWYRYGGAVVTVLVGAVVTVLVLTLLMLVFLLGYLIGVST